jgi:dTDP-glucose 4,6-dehydratase
VEDHCRGIELVLEGGRIGETYNIGGNNEWANIDIVELLCARIDARFAERPELAQSYPDAPPGRGRASSDLIKFVDDRLGHDRRYAIDAGKIMQELGYRPQQSFETGIELTIDWYLDNEAWWRPLLA